MDKGNKGLVDTHALILTEHGLYQVAVILHDALALQLLSWRDFALID